MTALAWDQVGDLLYETGVDRCVLYLQDGRAVPWNGITSVEDQSTNDSQALYLDGVKFLERQIPGDFSGSLKAYTYPTEFDEVLGITSPYNGLNYHNQKPKSFSLAYRTRIGNDVDGTDHGYKIHILYNLVAIPDAISHQTIDSAPVPTEFGWTLRGVPEIFGGFRPTVHISIDSTETTLGRVHAVERLLYGTEDTDPSLPDIEAFTTLFDTYNDLYIVDNGDGTWTATDPGEVYITMVSPTEFRMDDVNAVYLDPDTYELSDTEPDV